MGLSRYRPTERLSNGILSAALSRHRWRLCAYGACQRGGHSRHGFALLRYSNGGIGTRIRRLRSLVPNLLANGGAE